MAHLLGQLGFAATPAIAVPLLREAADLSSVDVPQPSYVFGMLLLGEFVQVTLPPALLAQTLPAPTPANPHPRASEARRRIERAAFLGFGPALYKVGWAYEHAKMGCTYDPLLSVQYYSAASQRGESEADMALSKWFLCGSEGGFDKDEHLAVVFAEKAANRRLSSGMFAMGYYYEVGVGVKADRGEAIKWYTKVSICHLLLRGRFLMEFIYRLQLREILKQQVDLRRSPYRMRPHCPEQSTRRLRIPGWLGNIRAQRIRLSLQDGLRKPRGRKKGRRWRALRTLLLLTLMPDVPQLLTLMRTRQEGLGRCRFQHQVVWHPRHASRRLCDRMRHPHNEDQVEHLLSVPPMVLDEVG